MNRFRFSTVSHGDHSFCSPLSSTKANELVELLGLSASSRLLDVGCGKAEFLLRAVQRYAATGVGVDPKGEFLRVARANAETRGLEDRTEWHEARPPTLC
jgi:cyclopropane fatty-acyl-phospholipid synthase-like methyltransferase